MTKLVLLGDFNDRCQTWISDHKDSELVFNLWMEFGLTEMVDEPTRNANILDLNIPNLIESYGVSDPINDLDHYSIYGVLKFTYVKKLCYFRTISSYTIDNLTTSNDNLSHVPWPSLIISEAGDIDYMVDSFTSILKDEIANAIPSKLNKQMENPDTSRKSYWKIIKSLHGQTKSTSIPEIVENGQSYRNVKDIVTILNNYFVAGKSNGVDGIGYNILRACAPSITEPLKMIAQKSIDTGVFLKSWKQSNVVPIFKHKGAKDSVANYRPISLLFCMSKVVERQVYNELYNFCMGSKKGGDSWPINKPNKWNISGFGWWGGDCYDLSWLKQSLWSSMAYWASSQIEKNGIRGSLLDWFKPHLTGRTHMQVMLLNFSNCLLRCLRARY